MRNLKILSAAAAALMALSGAAQAGTANSSFQVTATVATNCLVSATNLAFGSYDGTAQVDGSSTVSVRCTKGTAFTVKLDDGNANSFAPRKMANGPDTLEYNLYRDAARSLVWGDTAGVNTVAGVGSGMAPASAIAHTVYGRVPDSAANQDAPIGNYSDLINVTVEY